MNQRVATCQKDDKHEIKTRQLEISKTRKLENSKTWNSYIKKKQLRFIRYKLSLCYIKIAMY